MEPREPEYEFTLNVPDETRVIRHKLSLKKFSSGKLCVVDEVGWNLAYFTTDGKLHLPRGVPSSYPRDSAGHIEVVQD